MNQKGFAPVILVLFIVIILIILFTPIPFRYGNVVCKPCQAYTISCHCPKEGEIGWNPSIFQSIISMLRNTNSSVETQLINPTLPNPTAQTQSLATPSTTSVQVTVIPSTIPMDQWMTYKNDTYGFSFKYPRLKIADIKINNLNGPTTNSYQPIVYFQDERFMIPESDASTNAFEVFIELNPEGKSFDDYIYSERNIYNEEIKQYDRDPRYTYNEPSESSITIDNLHGVSFIYYPSGRDQIIYLPFPNSKKILVISRTNKVGGTFDEFNQILSTFKFTQ